MKLQGKSVIIKGDDLPEKTKRGTIIPRTAKELPTTGTVMDHGPGCELVRRGSRVHFSRKTSNRIYIDEELFYITMEGKLFYIE